MNKNSLAIVVIVSACSAQVPTTATSSQHDEVAQWPQEDGVDLGLDLMPPPPTGDDESDAITPDDIADQMAIQEATLATWYQDNPNPDDNPIDGVCQKSSWVGCGFSPGDWGVFQCWVQIPLTQYTVVCRGNRRWVQCFINPRMRGC